MTRLVRTELLKLATMRLTYELLTVAAALSAQFSLLENNQAGAAGSSVPPISTADGLRTVTTVTGFAMLFAAVLGSIVANGEFRHSTATLTYLATPKRTCVLLATVIASSCVGSIFGLVAGIIATGVGLAFVAGHGYRVALSAGTLAGHVAGAALLAGLGAPVGSLVRSQLATVIGTFVWAIIIESLIGGLYTSTRPYLPYTAAATLAGTKLGSAAFGPAHGLNGGGPLPFVAAAALVAGAGQGEQDLAGEAGGQEPGTRRDGLA